MDWLSADLAHEMAVPDFDAMMLRLGCAFAIGALVAYMPWRARLGLDAPKREMAHAQILMAVAGALVVTVVGDSLARAFGLVGLGGFVRFRTGLRDPRDAAAFFLIIGLGMACGLGLIGVAVVGTVFMLVVRFVLDVSARRHQRNAYRLELRASDVWSAAKSVRELLERLGAEVEASRVRTADSSLRFDVEVPRGIGVAGVEKALGELTPPLTQVAVEIRDPNRVVVD